MSKFFKNVPKLSYNEPGTFLKEINHEFIVSKSLHFNSLHYKSIFLFLNVIVTLWSLERRYLEELTHCLTTRKLRDRRTCRCDNWYKKTMARKDRAIKSKVAFKIDAETRFETRIFRGWGLYDCAVAWFQVIYLAEAVCRYRWGISAKLFPPLVQQKSSEIQSKHLRATMADWEKKNTHSVHLLHYVYASFALR